MPSVKIAKKSTDTDMTPFVDIGFLILSFFIMATKFKPPEPVPITTPGSVSSKVLDEKENAVLISIAPDDKVYITVLARVKQELADNVAKNVSSMRNLSLSDAEAKAFGASAMVGMPFNKLKGFLAVPLAEQGKYKQDGIPVLDSATNELVPWIAAAKSAFAGEKLKWLIKGANESKYPTFKAVIDALKRNDELKYNLVTTPEETPVGSDLERYNKEMQALKGGK